MFQNLQHIADITQGQHRALDAVSNSDLSNLAAEMLGQPRFFNQDALTFGTHFHTAVLEPQKFEKAGQFFAEGEKARTLWKNAGILAAVIRRQRYPRHVIYSSRGQAEQTFTAIHQPTGLLVKVRPDLLIDSPKKQRRTVVDFKTTSCRDLAQFLTTVEKYGYDQQAAFYADVLGAQRVVLIAVQKKAPKGQDPAVWVHELTAEQMETGRKKYRKMIRCYAEQQHQAEAASFLNVLTA